MQEQQLQFSFLIKKKDSPKVLSTGQVGQVVSDNIPQKNIISQKIVNEAIVTETIRGNTIVEKEDAKPVIISSKPVMTKSQKIAEIKADNSIPYFRKIGMIAAILISNMPD